MQRHRNEKTDLLRCSLWTCVSSHLPITLLWQALDYLPSSLPKLFKYVRSWSNRKVRSTQPTELPLWAVGDQTWKQEKNKGLSGQLKDVWTTAAHQNLFSETSMKYPPSARSSQTCQTPLRSLRKCAVKARRFLHMKTLPNLCFLTGVNK